MSAPELGCTVLHATDGAFLAKRIRRGADGQPDIKHFDHATWFKFETLTAPDLRTFIGKLHYPLASDPHAAIVRGAVLPHVRPDRSYLRRARAGDGTDSLADCARDWIACDMDDAPLPPEVEAVWRTEPEQAAAYLQSLLPPELIGVDCAWCWSGSMGFRAPGLARIKLWFWLAVPVADADLRTWAKAWNTRQGAKIIDPALFSPTQLHYIANPILGAGVADPLDGWGRWGWLPGMFAERATIVVPKVVSTPSGGGSQAPTGASFADRLMRIGASDEGFFEPLKAAIGMAVRMGLSLQDTIAAVRPVVLAADPGGRTPAEIRRYASDQFISSAYTNFQRQDAARRVAEAGTEFKPEPTHPARATRNAQRARALSRYAAMKQQQRGRQP